MTLMFWREHNGYREMVDRSTGEIRRLKLASDKQMTYLNSLREQVGKKPLAQKPLMFEAVEQIDKLVEKTRQQRLL